MLPRPMFAPVVVLNPAGNSSADLAITTTPNQDNPLMGQLPGAPAVSAAGCTPILGIDVWEHAYYLK